MKALETLLAIAEGARPAEGEDAGEPGSLIGKNSMTVRILVDTNVILYAMDHRWPEKRRRCTEWLKALTAFNAMTVSPQVCNETRNGVEKKLKMSKAEAREAARALLAYCTAPLGAEEVERAMAIETRWKTSWWDSVLLASAVGGKCTHFLTEDDQGAAAIEGVIILNPFETAPDAFAFA